MPGRDLVARARHRHGRRRPRRPGREPQVGRARTAAGRPRRSRARRRLEGPHLPEVPGRPARGGGRGEGDARGSDRGDAHPTQPARRARAADRRDLRGGGDRGRRPLRPRPRRLSVRRARAHAAGERARHARRPLPVGRVRRVAAADRLGPHRPASCKGRQGARRLAVTNAGTIPDRGLFGVFQVDGGGRVGELDEEMVYEARQGQTFLLGASTWRIEEITRDRVLVSPAPGVPGAVPFWKGEGVGRPVELGERIGRASREIVALSDAKALERLRGDYHLDELAAKNLLTFLRDQAETAGGVVPSDRTIVVERFRDEIGDWRLCILTPFGARVHAPWAMALGARLRDSLGLEAQSIWSDDGIALHLPEADVPPPIADLLLPPEEIEDLVVQEVGQTALFGSRFRENAGARPPDPAAAARPADAALAAAAEGAEPARGGAQLRLVPDRARDLPRVPAGRLRPARAEADPARACRPASSTSSRWRRRPPRRSRRRSSSPTSPRTCTRTTPRPRSAGRRRSRSTATCCGSCSGRKSCATCSTRPRSRTSRLSSRARRARPTSSTISCAGVAIFATTRLDAAHASGARGGAARGACAHGGRGAADRGRGRGPLP